MLIVMHPGTRKHLKVGQQLAAFDINLFVKIIIHRNLHLPLLLASHHALAKSESWCLTAETFGFTIWPTLLILQQNCHITERLRLDQWC
jgi:hypothetical protein